MVVERRSLWLGATLIVAIIAVMAVRSMDDAPSVPANRRPAPARLRGAATAADSAGGQEGPAKVHLESLTRVRGEPADEQRNPFRFRPKPAPPPPAPPVAPIARPGNQTAGPIVPAGPPPPPTISLKFIGIVQKADGTKIAVLTDGRRPLYGVEGQEIEGQYRILKIGLESLEIAYLDGRGRQTLRLPEK